MFDKKQSGLNTNLLVGTIVVLVVIIAVMGFFLGRLSAGSNSGVNNGNGSNDVVYDDLSIKVIKDSRDTATSVDGIVSELKALPSIQNAEFTIVDFEDAGIREYLTENGIKFLPAFIFSTNNFDVSKDPSQISQDGTPAPKINYYLTTIPSGEYELAIGATFDPFVERSDRGFRLLTEEQYDEVKASGNYIEGNEDAKITWLEYSDLQCPYCAKLYEEGTLTAVRAEYGDNLNIRFNHFPLSFHPNALPAAEVVECLGIQKGVDAFYSLVEIAFANNNVMNGSNSAAAKKLMIDEAVKLGADATTLESCVDANTYADKINNQMNVGNDIFSITGTPGNVLVNNDTLEYEILSGAYPVSYFEDIINKLLQ